MKHTRRAGFRRIVMVNWRDLHYAQIELDEHITVFEGGNSAGKTSIMLAALVTLMPDKHQLRIRQVSQEKNAIEAIFHRLHQREPISYAAVEMETNSERILAGVQIIKSKESISIELAPFIIRNLPVSESLQDLFRNTLGDREWTCNMTEVAQKAGELGACFKLCSTLSAYFRELYELGALPLPMVGEGERAQFAHLLETSMMGGLSQGLAVRLKNYLLPEYSKLPDAINRMQENLLACLATKNELENSSTIYNQLSNLFGGLHDYVGAIAETVQRALNSAKQKLAMQQDELRECEARILLLNGEEAGIKPKLDGLRSEKDQALACLDAQIASEQAKQKELADKQKEVGGPLNDYHNNKRVFDQSLKEWRNAIVLLKEADETVTVSTATELEHVIKVRHEELSQNSRDEQNTIDNLTKELTRLSMHHGTSPELKELASAMGASLVADIYSSVKEEEGRNLEAILGPLVNGLVVNDVKAALEKIATLKPQLDEIWITESKEPAADFTAKKLDAFQVVTIGSAYRFTRIPAHSTLGELSRSHRIDEIKKTIKRLQVNHQRITKQIGAFTAITKPIHRMDDQCLTMTEHDLVEAQNQWQTRIESITSEIASIQASVTQSITNAQAFANRKAEVANSFADKERDLNGQLNRIEQGYARETPLRDELKGQITTSIGEEMRWKTLWASCSEVPRLKQSAIQQSVDIGGKLQSLRILLLNFDHNETVLQLLPESMPDPIDPLAIGLPRVVTAAHQLIRKIQPHDLTECADPQDAIRKLQEKIRNLETQLAQQQKNFRTNIDTIAGAINSEINSRSHKIIRWSSDLRDVRFGKVRGIQMRLDRNEEQLRIIEGLKVQKDLFASGDLTLEQAIKKFFGQDLEISEALDYRRFVHLVIEVGDEHGKWRPVGGSTGEMIGSALSILIILLRAWEDEAIGRGSTQPMRLLFLDEAARLDETSHGTLQSLSTTLQIQFIVAAPSVSASGRFTHYSVATAQTADGNEVIIRGRRRFIDDQPKTANS